MNNKEFNKLLAYIDENMKDKKQTMLIYNSVYMFTSESSHKLEGLRIYITGLHTSISLYWCYDKVKTKYGFKYNKVMDVFNGSYNLTVNQKGKLLNKLSEYIE